jgi:cell division protein FtsI (penicillin-binding protein 3)/stage V sporulation protein D (sporulation-specific penicillin-binding protein)
MNGPAKRRVFLVCAALSFCFTGFSARLIHLQLTLHDEFAAKAAEKHLRRDPIYAKRGTIEDVHGEPLAQNEPNKVLIADGSILVDYELAAELMAGPLEMKREELLAKLKTQRSARSEKAGPSQYIIVKRGIPEQTAREIDALLRAAGARDKQVEKRLRGLRFEPDNARVYPNGSMLCHVIGFVNGDHAGIEGIERSCDQYLAGNDGFRYVERDRRGRELVPYRGQERPPRDGFNVRLTVDMAVQQIVEQELDAAFKQFRPKMAVGIVMRPQTGEILAMANRPNFDLNDIDNSPIGHRRNRAITDAVEPGSTFKIVTISAVLNEHLVRPDNVIFCENGYYKAHGVHDSHPYGDLTVQEVLIKSSNIGVAKLALQLGDQKLYGYARLFGFGDRTGVLLPGETGGIVHLPHSWTTHSITRVPIGQEIAVSPLQVITAMSAIANGGALMIPQIVSEVREADGTVVSSCRPQFVRQVASKSAIDAVREALAQVPTPKGTARFAAVPGFKVAGKTGTAQKYDKHGPAHDRHLCSFVGYLPAEAPEFTVLVMIDEPVTKSNEDTGGWVAAPVFSRIAERIARHMNLVPAPAPAPGGLIATQPSSSRR